GEDHHGDERAETRASRIDVHLRCPFGEAGGLARGPAPAWHAFFLGGPARSPGTVGARAVPHKPAAAPVPLGAKETGNSGRPPQGNGATGWLLPWLTQHCAVATRQ